MYIYSSNTVYKNSVSTSIVWESHLLINPICSMTRSVTPVTTGEYFLVKYTPVIWVYPRATRRDLNLPSILFLNTHFESIMCLFQGIFLLLDFTHTTLYHVLGLLSDGCTPEFMLFWICMMQLFLKVLWFSIF